MAPGDVIDKSNVAKAKDLISPAIEWCVNQGMSMKIIEPKPIGWPKAYREATEKYANQVKLAENGLALQGLRRGRAVPEDRSGGSEDRAQGDVELRVPPVSRTDDFVEYDFPAETGAVGHGKPMEVERYYWIGESRRMYYNARLYVDPKPALETPRASVSRRCSAR